MQETQITMLSRQRVPGGFGSTAEIPPDLPVEVWDAILAGVATPYLAVCALVCKEWAVISERHVSGKYAESLKREARSRRSEAFLMRGGVMLPRCGHGPSSAPGPDPIEVAHIIKTVRRADKPFHPYLIAEDGHIDLLKWLFLNLIARGPEARSRHSPRRLHDDVHLGDGEQTPTADHHSPCVGTPASWPSFGAISASDGGSADAGDGCASAGGITPNREVRACRFVEAAARGNAIACLDWLISEGMPAGDALREAASNGREEAVRWLADSGYVLEGAGRKAPRMGETTGRTMDGREHCRVRRADAVEASLRGETPSSARWCFDRGLFEWRVGLESVWAGVASVAGSFESIAWLAEAFGVNPLRDGCSPDLECFKKVLTHFGRKTTAFLGASFASGWPHVAAVSDDAIRGEGDRDGRAAAHSAGDEIPPPASATCAGGKGTGYAGIDNVHRADRDLYTRAGGPWFPSERAYVFSDNVLTYAIYHGRADTVQWILGNPELFARLDRWESFHLGLLAVRLPECVRRGYSDVASALLR